jgi:hypothetical protein
MKQNGYEISNFYASLRPTRAAHDPAALRGRLVEGRAQKALPARSWVIIAGHVSQSLGAQKRKMN